jgi:hypothetical protein
MRSSEAKRTMDLLRQALTSAQGSDLLETRKSIQQAMLKLEAAAGKRGQKAAASQTEAQKWWEKVVSGVGSGKVSGEAAMRNLKALNKMIGLEEKSIVDIEQEVAAATQAPAAATQAPDRLIKD